MFHTIALSAALIATVNGNAYAWPPIGTIAYSEGCTITHAWEDGSATAYCPEDGAVFQFDPDGQPAMSHTPNRYPQRDPGWAKVN